jgi:hypothetical protein
LGGGSQGARLGRLVGLAFPSLPPPASCGCPMVRTPDRLELCDFPPPTGLTGHPRPAQVSDGGAGLTGHPRPAQVLICRRFISSYADWDVKARLPHGIDVSLLPPPSSLRASLLIDRSQAIRKHLKEVDNVPLLVSLFTDSTPATTKSMIEIFRENGEVVLSLGSAYRCGSAPRSSLMDWIGATTRRSTRPPTWALRSTCSLAMHKISRARRLMCSVPSLCSARLLSASLTSF